jgi:hypothetical protein
VKALSPQVTAKRLISLMLYSFVGERRHGLVAPANRSNVLVSDQFMPPR